MWRRDATKEEVIISWNTTMRSQMVTEDERILTDKQREYYDKLADTESKEEFLQLLRESLGPLNATVLDLSGERESQTIASTLTTSCLSRLGENKGGLFYQKVFRKFKFVSQEMEVFNSAFCNAVFDWKNETEDAERWVNLKKAGMSAVSEARTQLQNRVKEYFISKCDGKMMSCLSYG